MNREQMIAWLTLEGWRPYNTERLSGGKHYHATISQNGESGYPPESTGAYLQPLFSDDEPVGWDTVPTDHIKAWVLVVGKNK